MPMRTECKHYESRTYANGDTVRRCGLDKAPEAPWRCPSDCSFFELRLVDVAWSHGSLTPTSQRDEPQGEGIAELLDAAEDIINSAAPEAMAEVQRAEKRRGSRWGRFWARVRRSDR